jgi:hypothetical protein
VVVAALDTLVCEHLEVVGSLFRLRVSYPRYPAPDRTVLIGPWLPLGNRLLNVRKRACPEQHFFMYQCQIADGSSNRSSLASRF